MVVVQLAEQLLSVSEVGCSNPVVGEFLSEELFIVNCTEKTKIKEKRGRGMAHFLSIVEKFIFCTFTRLT